MNPLVKRIGAHELPFLVAVCPSSPGSMPLPMMGSGFSISLSDYLEEEGQLTLGNNNSYLLLNAYFVLGFNI